MNSSRKLPTRVRLVVVALARVAVTGVASVLAHATVPGTNGQIVFRGRATARRSRSSAARYVGGFA